MVPALRHVLAVYEIKDFVLEREEVYGHGVVAEDETTAFGVVVTILALEVNLIHCDHCAEEVAGGVGEDNAEGRRTGVSVVTACEGDEECEEQNGESDTHGMGRW